MHRYPRWPIHLTLLAASFVMLVPFYWVLKTSISGENIFAYPPSVIPKNPQAAAIHAAAQALGVRVGFIGEAAHSVGGYVAGLPTANVHEVLGKRAFVLLNVEPQLDLGSREVEIADVALLDLSLDGRSSKKELSLIDELTSATPPTSVLVFTSADTFTDRIEVARRGGKGFLDRSLPARAAIEAASQLLTTTKSGDLRVLAVDDDPRLLDLLKTLLEPQGLSVTTLRDPMKFWDTLEETSPDLLLLDLEMPGISGLELCRVVRNEPRWAGVPILLLTAHQGPDVVDRVFAAGADDYLTKPVVGPEVITRILNRLERIQL
jgi:DNA-binding response OmpR family regulator